jgi:hypothetical protein
VNGSKTAPAAAVKNLRPPMNTDKRRLKIHGLSALIGGSIGFFLGFSRSRLSSRDG